MVNLSIKGTCFNNLNESLYFPAQYKVKLQPAFSALIAFVVISSFNDFIEMSSEIKIPLKPISSLIIFFIIILVTYII